MTLRSGPGVLGVPGGGPGLPVGTSDLLEYPFITLKCFPPGFLHRIGMALLDSCPAFK